MGLVLWAFLFFLVPVLGNRQRTDLLPDFEWFGGKRSTGEGSQQLSFILIKPDGVQRRLVGEIISRFERKGFKLQAMEMFHPERETLERHYDGLKDKPYFNAVIDYMNSGPVIGMIWSGREVVAYSRTMLGKTNPLESAPGTIRGDLGIAPRRNLVHASDSEENALREIGIWFGEKQGQTWTDHSFDWLYE
eukprot:Platyproteum_vivax@DN950_c0_g1_i1.p1